MERNGKSGDTLFIIAAISFFVAIFYVLTVVVSTVDITRVRNLGIPFLILALLSGVICIGGWLRGRRVASALGSTLAGARDQIKALSDKEASLEATSEALSEKVEELGVFLTEERSVRTTIEKAKKLEREWLNVLRNETFKARHAQGSLSDGHDLPALVLRTAMTLLGGTKGILLGQRDEDADGKLDFIAAEGFENDPDGSYVAQRFAGKVLEKDRTIREEEIKIDPDKKTPADEEIKNLVAIPVYVMDNFSAVVICANNPNGFGEHDDDVLLALGDHAGAILENARLHGQLRGSYLSTVRMLADAIEAKDAFLRGHSDEVSGYVAAVADRLGVEAKQREELVFASLLHDVGKIGISERILLKPGKLTPEEFNVIKLHPRIGYRLIQQVPALDPIALGILHHHERYDGGGYPSGLRGEEIPLEARIICVADSFSAMTAERPYRGRMSLEEACAELEKCAGTQFDPEVVKIFVDEVRRRPPSSKELNALNQALNDPELDMKRDGDEPVLGHDSMAVTDNLTLLYSRRYFHEVTHAEAQRAAVQKQPFSIMLIELADIETTNQEKGYNAGDRAIKAAAAAVQRAAVRCGGTACRYSGPRIGLIMPKADAGKVDECGRSIVDDLADGPKVAWGCATWVPGATGDDVIGQARSALDELRADAA